ncbi:MAG: response regulator transcription factor [Lachnospiraceae bacterium]|nr:response regulator transcription factor [Lachnospiraceae bacterium]
MYQIVICDKDNVFRENFYQQLEKVTKKFCMECCIIQCEKAEQVKDMFRKMEQMDLLFLGIELEKSLGFELGKYIREKLYDFDTPIVYVSEKPEHAMKLFETMAFDFLLKPVSEEKLQSMMERFLTMNKKAEYFFQFSQGKIQEAVHYNKIIYFQSASPKLLVYTKDGTNDFYGKLDDVERQLPENFVRIHKSYIVNTYYVKKSCYNGVTLLDEQKLPISRSYKERVRKFFT